MASSAVARSSGRCRSPPATPAPPRAHARPGTRTTPPARPGSRGHVLEPAEGAAAGEGDVKQVAKPRIARRAGEIRHPAILDRRPERLDADQVPCRQPGVDLLLRRPVVVLAEAIEGNHLDLAVPHVEVAGELAGIRGQRHLQILPVHRHLPRRHEPGRAAPGSSPAPPRRSRGRRGAGTARGAAWPARPAGPSPGPRRG